MDLHQQLKYFYQNQSSNCAAELPIKKEQSSQQVNVKMAHQSIPQTLLADNQTIAQAQRKLFTFIYIYAIVIVTLYLTYSCYYFFSHQSQFKTLNNQDSIESNSIIAKSAVAQQLNIPADELESKLETKIHLLERYIELIAVDLQETKNRLREREKCDCNIGCIFNNTNYADNSSWQSNCDICSCKSGKISCQPQKCPTTTNCDVAITLPGQCCPTCMKNCKYNNVIYRHNHKFVPNLIDSKLEQSKECKCDDGQIKCELKPVRAVRERSSSIKLRNNSHNRTNNNTNQTFGQPNRLKLLPKIQNKQPLEK